jgi:hypothetical protein
MTEPITRQSRQREARQPVSSGPSSAQTGPAAIGDLRASAPARAAAAAHLADRFLGGDNWVLSGAEEQAVLDKLGAVDAKDLPTVVGAMGEAQLRRFTDALDDRQRGGFIAICQRAGMLTASGGGQPSGPLSPPSAPRFVVNDPLLPAPLREAVHTENLARADAYEERYADYHQRWADAFHAAPSMAARRQLGPPVPYAMPNAEPGAAGHDALATAMTGDWVHRPRAAGHFNYATCRAVTYAVAEDQHRVPGGSLEFFGELEAKLALNITGEAGPTVGLSAKAEGSTRGDGRVRDPQVAVLATSGGGPVAVRHDNKGTSALAVDVSGRKGGVEVELKRKADGTIDGEAYGKLGLAKIGVSDKGQVVVALVEEVSVEGDLGSAKLVAAAGARFNPAASPEMLERALRDHGPFFEAPPELLAQTPWSDLPAQRRTDLHLVLGWTAQEWSARQALLAAPTRPLLR